MNKHITYKGHNIIYRDIGNGTPVLLVHGFGETGNVWEWQIPELEKKNRLIIPDLPGSGKSELLSNEQPDMDLYASVLIGILDEEKISKVIYIGHSMGGYIGMAFADRYPERLLALGLFHSSALSDTEEKVEVRKKGIEFIKNHGAASFLASITPNLFADAGNPLKNRLLKEAEGFTDKSLILYYEAMIRRPDRTLVLKKLNVPFLMIAGRYDHVVPYKSALQQSHIADCSFIYVLRESGHMGMWEEPGKSNEILANFLQRF